MKRFARIAVNVPGVRDAFDYAIPEELLNDIQLGCLVEVPFGSQRVQGIVVELLDEPGVAKVRPISALIEDLPALTSAQLELGQILSKRYLAPASEFYNLMLPPGLSQRADTLYILNLPEKFDEETLTAFQRRLISHLREKGARRGRQLDAAFRHIDWRSSARALLRKGLLVSRAVPPHPTVSRKTVRTVNLAIPREALEEALEKAGRKGSDALRRRQSILKLLASKNEPLDVSYIYASSGGSSADLNYLYQKGFIDLGQAEMLRDPLREHKMKADEAPKLTAGQQAVWNQIEALISRDAVSKPILMHGVTGSGKTELYMRAIDKTLKAGRQAIMLVPEISLTPQTIDRFISRFGAQVGVIHSKLSPGERYDTWRRAREADFRIAIGPRSALFTPFPNIGVIVLDEFHDESYTQTEINPYYSSVEAAIVMGKLMQAMVLFGSATPDVSTYFRAQREGWHLFELPERIRGHGGELTSSKVVTLSLPKVSVVDMREELRQGNTSIFSRELKRQISDVLAAKQQAILLLNRRGSATWVFCRDCGLTLKCPRCDLALTWHHRAAKLLCHTCGYTRGMPKRCPQCGSMRIRQFGSGTEKIENELKALFPQARLLRWDADTARAKGAEEIMLAHFRQHNADILIGTQMLAKGLDLPLVTLVGVVLAEVGLNFPDYRSAERTFQLLTQVAGRAGRSALGGRVVLQTFQAEHYAILHAAAHDFKGFYKEEVEKRRALRYPPFVHMVRFEARALQNEEAQKTAQAVYQKLNRLVKASQDRSLELLPPLPPYFARRGGYYRWQVLLKGSDPLKWIKDEDFSDVRVEVDPPSLL